MAEAEFSVSMNGTETAMVIDKSVNGNSALNGTFHGSPNESSSPPLKKQRHPETLLLETTVNPNSLPSSKTLISTETLTDPSVHSSLPNPLSPLLSKSDRHVAAAWEYFRKLGSPKFHVAPMVDQSELPFRMLCRKYGATAAYTPMLHSRLYAEDSKYRREFTTCQEDRPLFVQFCANSPETLLAAAKLVVPFADYVDINFGCPQRIAKRGNYGAFLMDNLPLVRSLVSELSENLSVPVSCKIRVFPTLEETLAYARMIEEAGCSLLAVHGRTRDQKNQKAIRADWDIIRAVKQSVRIPVIANGNVRWLEDAEECMRVTGVDGVMSAEALLENPALFGGYRLPGNEGEKEGKEDLTEQDIRQRLSSSEELPESRERTSVSHNGAINGTENGKMNGEISGETRTEKPDQISLILEYLDLAEKYPVPPRMVRAHVHKVLGCWFRVHKDIRERLNKAVKITPQWLKELVMEMKERNRADPSLRPLPEAPEKRGIQVVSPLEKSSQNGATVSQGESQSYVSTTVVNPNEVINPKEVLEKKEFLDSKEVVNSKALEIMPCDKKL